MQYPVLLSNKKRQAGPGVGAERHWRRRASIGEGQFVLPVFLQFRGVVVAGGGSPAGSSPGRGSRRVKKPLRRPNRVPRPCFQERQLNNWPSLRSRSSWNQPMTPKNIRGGQHHHQNPGEVAAVDFLVHIVGDILVFVLLDGMPHPQLVHLRRLHLDGQVFALEQLRGHGRGEMLEGAGDRQLVFPGGDLADVFQQDLDPQFEALQVDPVLLGIFVVGGMLLECIASWPMKALTSFFSADPPGGRAPRARYRRRIFSP